MASAFKDRVAAYVAVPQADDEAAPPVAVGAGPEALCGAVVLQQALRVGTEDVEGLGDPEGEGVKSGEPLGKALADDVGVNGAVAEVRSEAVPLALGVGVGTADALSEGSTGLRLPGAEGLSGAVAVKGGEADATAVPLGGALPELDTVP